MKKHSINLSKAEKFLLNLMPAAGEILKLYFKKENLKAKQKGKHDYVTEADLAVDEFVQNNLRSEFPHIPILSEETFSGGFEKYKKKLLWVIDPLDGTTNFSRRIPHFAICIALVSKSMPIIGAVYNPVYNDFFWARKDKEGAYLNGKEIFVSKVKDPDEAIVNVDWSHNLKVKKKTVGMIKKLTGKVRSIKIMGSAASDLCSLAAGKIESYAHFHCFPWDVAAACLIAQKAGAKVTNIDGGRWNVFTPSILAANPSLHPKMIKILTFPPLSSWRPATKAGR